MTRYRLTIDRVKDLLRRWKSYPVASHPDGWMTIGEILEHCETHYSSPKPSLSQALLKFEADWCETKKEGGRLWFRHK